MYPVFETIKVLDGHHLNLGYHFERMQKTCRHLWKCEKDLTGLKQQLEIFHQDGLYKCRIMYDADTQAVSYALYEKKAFERLRVIIDDTIEYPYKYTDRSVFLPAERLCGHGDHVVYCRQGLLTDTTYANIALWDGGRWVTPARPLFYGTKRQSLIENGLLVEYDIALTEMTTYQKISLINAMLDLGESEIEISAVCLL
ncbi:uncharacterized protein HI_1169 [Filimonas sp.]|nr:uncharacterized protein HI_1169 [Filimonas sp.]